VSCISIIFKDKSKYNFCVSGRAGFFNGTPSRESSFTFRNAATSSGFTSTKRRTNICASYAYFPGFIFGDASGARGLNFRLPAAFNLESESDDSMCWNLPAEDLSDGT
jgi:hypothetical protein